jgi:hypothetical protein
MAHGVEFLRRQVSNAVMMHWTLVQTLKDHENQATDQRIRDLCVRSIPKMLQHQRMLEDYQLTLGADEGLANKAAGVVVGAVRELADVVREDDDFLPLVGDIVLARQLEDTFKTFRDAGRTLGLEQLAKIGEIGERHHDEYAREANRLAQQIFVEHVRDAEPAIRDIEEARTSP